MLKLCKDCRFYKDDLSQCLKTEFIDPVHGVKKHYYCSIERQTVTGCGPEGRWWEKAEEICPQA